ncbi:MAG TPA: glycosyltransferase [Candidatus Binatia bacterium]|nr:glycosyltransferase [Candidatus Binatia bacterium]
MHTVAYLFPAFPVFHQTFVLWEVLGLRRNGVLPRIYSLRPGTERQQPEACEIAREINQLPGMFSAAVCRANWRRARRQPRRYFSLYRDVVRAWWPRVLRDRTEATGRVGTYERVRGWYNSQPLLYLLKSLLLVPTAVLLAEWLERDGVTHLHVHWASYPATVAYVVHRLTGLPFSISAHAYDIYMVPRMLPAKLRAAEFLVTCARTNAQYLERLVEPVLRDKIVVLYHGVDVARFSGARNRPRLAQAVTIMSCGQLEQYKGMHHLVDACAAIHRRGVAVRCIIVGDGPQRGPLQRQIDRLGLSEQVELVGARPHVEVAKLLAQADVFALASELAGAVGRRDVIANVVVEAMAAGLPVVVSRIPGMEELVEDAISGILVAPNRADELAEALARLAANPLERERMGQAARVRVSRDFDASKNVRRLASLLSHTNMADRPMAAASQAEPRVAAHS